ncbi:MAG: ornithine cyclodeaminase family protein [candidate division Zixibacteria bacterium]|nr:ornithine cyclodeaminase family protein [candidate division Zixibacteria bacterium]NIR64098.1 ornithine cyclodeaminase family protein [candidate division Zixibacteria bacterium]NIS15427.1 ornithine cyclodeaminase family protein [candidate division Zixibacteria bacterium]NIS45996.1 ornithine cyclodeaminase family protein [candidate division Zixibacteria bacterium]NIT51955.1 ornithine cyclodeaminase family protein [candidate division Zixibacteria bacterium]
MPLLLSRDDVIKVLEMDDCMAAVEQAFAEMAKGTAVLPLRIPITPPDGLALYMPAYLKEMGALACKVVTVYKNNPTQHNLPTVIGKVLLQNPETGEVICIMDGGYLTAVRTGAASGVATKYLARKDKNQIAGIFGAGVQAQMQLWAVAVARDLSKAYVFDISDQAVDNCIKVMSKKLNLEIIKADSAEQILKEADIICTATSSAMPIFDGEKVREGTHLNGIGSHTPNARELDTAIIKKSKLIADSYDACLKEAGDIMIPIEEGAIDQNHMVAELGEVITGKKPSRENDSEITLFKSNGLAVQDVATAKLVYDKALKANVGNQVEL